MGGSQPDEAPKTQVAALLKLSGLALVVGVVAGAGAAGFVAATHHLTKLLWEHLPQTLGFAEPPWWLVIGLPVVGGILVFAAMKLPGHGGHSPLDPLAMDIGPAELASAFLAALASLSFGAVLGPEAPLVAVGSALGAAALRPGNPARRVTALVGAGAAIGAIFGNPMVTGILLLEMALTAGAAMAAARVMLPAMVGLAGGYLLQVGVGKWTGLGQSQLGISGLGAYPSVRLGDLAVGLVVAVVVAAITLAALSIARSGRRLVTGRPLVGLVSAGALIGLTALIAQWVTGKPIGLVIFAGQSAIGDYLGLTVIGVAVVILVAKFVAYVASLGGGFRGGVVFPAISMATIVTAIAATLVGIDAQPALLAAAIGAATAAAIGMPFTSALLATLLTSAAGPATTVPAIIGAAVGIGALLLAKARWGEAEPSDPETTGQPAPATGEQPG